MTTMIEPVAYTGTSVLPVPGQDVQPLHTVCIPPAFTKQAVSLHSSGRLDDWWRELGEMSDEAGDYTTFVARLTDAGTIQYGIEIRI